MVKKRKNKRLKSLFTYKEATENTQPSSIGGGINTTKRKKPSLRSANMAATKVPIPSINRSLTHIKKDKSIDVPLHADMLKISVLILQEMGYCQMGKTKGGDSIIIFPKEFWDETLSLLKPRK